MNQQSDPFFRWRETKAKLDTIPPVSSPPPQPIQLGMQNQMQPQQPGMDQLQQQPQMQQLQQPPQQETQQLQTQEQKPDPFAKWKKDFPFEGENDLDREIERNIAQQTSRMGETILGMPGDLYSFAKTITGFNPETNLPTSKSLRERSEKVSLGYTTPKSEGEEKAGEVMQDIASFMIPGSGQYGLVRNLGIPIVANIAKEGIKLTGHDKTADAAKIGTMIVLDLVSHRKGGAKKYASALFNESEKLIPEGATLKSPKFQDSILKLEKSFESGGSAPSKERALKKLGEIKDRMLGDEIEVKELIDFRKTINEIRSELGGFNIEMPKHIKQKAIHNLDKVKGQIIGALDEYGKKTNPKFGKLNSSANEAYAAYQSSDKMADFIKKTSEKFVKHNGLKAILGLGGAYAFPAIAAKTAGSAIPLKVGYEGYKVLHQVVKSPTLRKYYGNILKGAAAGNASQVTQNVKALQKKMEEEEIGYED
jgi:hypothetical protein